MRIGLRARVAAVIAFVSALTLAVAAVTLLSPLEHQLRQNALTSLRQSLRNEQGALQAVTAHHVAPGDRRLRRAANVLARHNGAAVSVLTPDGALLVSTDPDRDDPFTTLAAAARTDRPQQRVVVDAGPAEAEVSFPLRIDGRRVIVAARKPLESVQDASAVVRRAFLVAAAAGLGAALFAGLLLAGRLVWRVRHLRDTALRVAEIGPDAELKPDHGRDEVGELSRAFATMQDRLREQERSRRAFVATASHELRTPLASLSIVVDNLLEELRAQPPDLVSARAQAESAEAQVQRLALLSGRLLDLSRIDAGIQLRSESVELSAVLRSVAAELEVRLAAQGRQITLHAPDDLRAVGDPGSVAQILRLLLDNALRHSPGAGHVVAQAELHGETARVLVRDDGPGVAPADRERIFERFERGGAATDGGFGLGLAIGRELARRMEGDLTLEPSAGGACFALSLPGGGQPS